MLRPDSFGNMQLNAGAFFEDIDTTSLGLSTTAAQFATILEQALVDNKQLGATIGGGTFAVTPEVRQIEADGMRYPVIGSTVFDSYDVLLTTTIKEFTRDNIKRCMPTAEVEPATGAIVFASALVPEHYIPSLGWAGQLLDGRLLYVELQNVLNTTGMTLTFTDKGEGTIDVEFRGHQARLDLMQYAPCKVFFFDL